MPHFIRNILHAITGRGAPAGVYGRVPRALEDYEALYDARYGDWREGPGGAPMHASVEREVGRLWYALVAMLRPARILESGTWRGYSTCCLGAALDHLNSFDPFPREIVTIDIEAQDHLWKGTRLAEFITFMLCDAASAPVTGEFDMLVLDSDHAYPTIAAEIEALEPRLRVGGTLLLHDSLYFDGVGGAVRTLQASGRFEMVTFDTPRHTLDFPRSSGRSVYRTPGVTLARKNAAGAPIRPDPSLMGLVLGDVKAAPLLRNPSKIQTSAKAAEDLPSGGVQT